MRFRIFAPGEERSHGFRHGDPVRCGPKGACLDLAFCLDAKVIRLRLGRKLPLMALSRPVVPTQEPPGSRLTRPRSPNPLRDRRHVDSTLTNRLTTGQFTYKFHNTLRYHNPKTFRVKEKWEFHASNGFNEGAEPKERDVHS